jgi:glycosyltransferase involved in cell wall biosynthesis
MKISFILPGYVWIPGGGSRIVYEYAHHLAERGHDVSVIHPRNLQYPGSEAVPLYDRLRSEIKGFRKYFSKPVIEWQTISDRVQLVYVPNASAPYLPDADAIFATGWQTVDSVLKAPESKGKKCYLIQGYEACMGPKKLVDATWRAPLHKIVVSNWLVEIGRGLGCDDLTHISNAIDHSRYRVSTAFEDRPKQVAMMFSPVSFKGAADGIEAARIARETTPDFSFVLFGTTPRKNWVPDWAVYHHNPSQDFIVNEIYNRSRIFLSSSWAEGFALPPAEAAACGCAVVASDSGGIRDFIQDGTSGLLSAPKDPAALARNLRMVLDDQAMNQRLATAGGRVIRGLKWQDNAARVEEFLHGALHSNQTAASRV